MNSHPSDSYLRTDRLPHLWCPGCGIGATMNSFVEAVKLSGISRKSLAVVSGIGCSGRVAGYLKADSFHTTHGRAIPFATGLALANPGLRVAVYSGEGDLVAIGGNHLLHAARRNVNIIVVCINNFTYGMTGGQLAPTTPIGSITATTPYGSTEMPCNLVNLAASAGAVFVARWTVFHVRQLACTMAEALVRRGFSFIEVLSPCPTLHLQRNNLGHGETEMRYFKEYSRVANNTSPVEAGLDRRDRKIIVGTFVKRERAVFFDSPDSVTLVRKKKVKA